MPDAAFIFLANKSLAFRKIDYISSFNLIGRIIRIYGKKI